MNSAQAKKVVIVSTLVVIGISTVKALRESEAPRPSIYLGGAIGAFGLGLVAGPAPAVAATFAGLWATGSLINGGEVVATATTAAINRKKQPRKDR
jgi:hypothetical protein